MIYINIYYYIILYLYCIIIILHYIIYHIIFFYIVLYIILYLYYIIWYDIILSCLYNYIVIMIVTMITKLHAIMIEVIRIDYTGLDGAGSATQSRKPVALQHDATWGMVIQPLWVGLLVHLCNIGHLDISRPRSTAIKTSSASFLRILYITYTGWPNL